MIGVGGGFPMDASKAIALMMANPEHDERLLYYESAGQRTGPVYPAFPVAEVPTTAGDGSGGDPRMLSLPKRPSGYCAHHSAGDRRHRVPFPSGKKKTKQSISHHIFPALALLDVSLSADGIPQRLYSYGMLDTLAHLIESHLNTNTTSYSRIYSEMGLPDLGQDKG